MVYPYRMTRYVSRALLVIVDVHSLYTTCSCLTNGRAYLDSGMVSIIFFLTKYCCSSIPEVPSIVVNPSDWAIDPYCSIILLSQYLLIVLSICSTCRIAALTANRHLFHS